MQQWCHQAKTRQQKNRKKDREQAEKQNFLTLGDLVKSSNKVFIKLRRFFCQQKEDMMEWLWDRLCNVIEIKNNEKIQSFLVERTWNQWFFFEEDFLHQETQKKEDVFRDLTTVRRIRILTERKVGSVKQHGGL